MKRKITKFISVALSVLIVLSSLSIIAFADGTVKRTETLDLNAEGFDVDCSNEAEGWSWDADTQTLTLNNVNFDTEGNDAIIIAKKGVTTIIMVGESTIATKDDGLAVSRGYFEGAVVFKGDGVLNVEYEGDVGSMDVGSFTLESGTLNISGGAVFILNTVIISGGTLNFDTSGCMSSNGQGFDGFYILNGGAEILGGVVNIYAERFAFFVVGVGDYDSINTDKGLVIKGGDVTLCGEMAASWVGYIDNRETVIETTGTVTIKSGRDGIGLYCGKGSIDIRGGIINNPDGLETEMLFRIPGGSAKIAKADYSAVDAAISKIPADLSVFTNESVAAVQEAVNAVDRELNVLDQRKVNDYAAAIEATVDALEEMTLPQKIAEFFNNLFNADGETDSECWLVKIFKAIAGFFATLYKFFIDIL